MYENLPALYHQRAAIIIIIYICFSFFSFNIHTHNHKHNHSNVEENCSLPFNLKMSFCYFFGNTIPIIDLIHVSHFHFMLENENKMHSISVSTRTLLTTDHLLWGNLCPVTSTEFRLNRIKLHLVHSSISIEKTIISTYSISY